MSSVGYVHTEIGDCYESCRAKRVARAINKTMMKCNTGGCFRPPRASSLPPMWSLNESPHKNLQLSSLNSDLC